MTDDIARDLTSPVGRLTTYEIQELIGPGNALLISSAHKATGGLYAICDGQWEQVDAVPSMGLAFNGRTLARALLGVQHPVEADAEIAWFDDRGLVRLERLDGLAGVHDLMVDPHDDEAIYIVSSATNSVVRHKTGLPLRELIHPGSLGDGSHRNCLVHHRGATYLTAFSGTNNRREWNRPEAVESGMLIELGTRRVVLDGLSRPHTPMRTIDDDGWVLANSGAGQILWCFDTGERVAIDLGDWPQDIIRCGEHLIVGVSHLRTREDPTDGDSRYRARLVMIHERDRRVVASMEVGTTSIYDMLVVPERLMDGVRVGFMSNQWRYFPRSSSAIPYDIVPHSDEPVDANQRIACVRVEATEHRVVAGDDVLVKGEVRYLGSRTLATTGTRPVLLGWRWADGSDEGRFALSAPLIPHRRQPFEIVVPAPLSTGTHRLELGLLQETVAWFDDLASVDFEVVDEPAAMDVERDTTESPASLLDTGDRRCTKIREVAAVERWWHSLDLGDGVVTPGTKSPEWLDAEWDSFRLPSLVGKSVLDIGAWDGYFSFAAERAGAERVVAIDDFVWTIRWQEFDDRVDELREQGRARVRMRDHSDLWDFDNTPGKAGFDLCRRWLGSGVESVVANYMDVGPSEIGVFDVVLYLGVLYHEPNPVLSMEKVRSLTRSLAIVETTAVYMPGYEHLPLAQFYPEDELGEDPTNWWGPNRAAVCAIASTVGFNRVTVTHAHPEEWSSLPPGSPPQTYRLALQCHVD